MTSAEPSRSADPVGAASTTSYRPEIDGLRGLAVLAVVINHLNHNWLEGGFLGVDIFFVISGYVITASINSRLNQPLGMFLGEFYRRRVQRLAPALITCVAITGLLTCLFVTDPSSSLITGATALFGVSNIYLLQESTNYFGLDASLNTFTQTWSLGIEEQFYLVFPAMAWWLMGRDNKAQRGLRPMFLAVLSGLIVLSLYSFLKACLTDPTAAYFLTKTRLWELLAGAVLFELRRNRTSKGGDRQANQIAILPLALLIIPFWLKADDAIVTIPITVIATALLVWALEQPSWVRTMLMLFPFRQLGLISYSLYLWHWSVLCLARWTVGTEGWCLPLLVLLMLGLAIASHHWIETPLRHRAWAKNPGGTFLKGGAISAGLASLMVWLAIGGGGQRLHAGEPTLTKSQALREQTVDGTAITRTRCHINKTTSLTQEEFSNKAGQCTAASIPKAADPGSLKPTVFLAGDSHASALIPLEDALHQEGFGVAHMSMDGCIFPPSTYGNSNPKCNLFQQQWSTWMLIRGQPGDIILISGYWLSHLGENIGKTRNNILGPHGQAIQSGMEKTRLFLNSINQFGTLAQAKGMHVVVIGAGPRLLDRDRCLPEWFRPNSSIRPCITNFKKQKQYAKHMNQAIGIGLHKDIYFIEPNAFFCEGRCNLNKARYALFDSDHPSPKSARSLKNELIKIAKHSHH
jgi:peptidoglycan/LPS O-acetylase OafA/YrhL